MKMNLDPKMAYIIVAVVVVGSAFLVYRGANSNAKTPLPDASKFNGPAATTHSSTSK